MSDVGLTFAWLAVQVAALLLPAIGLYAWASGKGPASAAFVAALGLGLVVILDLAAFLPRSVLTPRGRVVNHAGPSLPADAALAAPEFAVEAPNPANRAALWNRSLADLATLWGRLQQTASEPARRLKPWWQFLAVAALAGAAFGLVRLTLGFCAVAVCRWSGRPVEDPVMIGLLDDLRSAMGCRRPIPLLAIPGLVGPATAGWLRPVILLPGDWLSWEPDEKRVVLSHELAHILRNDYAVGLIARLAVALNFFHPVVRWMAARLRLEQELASDALGAQHAGGRDRYRAALSGLALKQEAANPRWPARAFLPERGTLIRRIAMLRQEIRTGNSVRPFAGVRRLGVTMVLVTVTGTVASFRAPARSLAEEPVRARLETSEAEPHSSPLILRDTMNGVLVIRPAAAFRHAGMEGLAEKLDRVLSDVVTKLNPEPRGSDGNTRPESSRLSVKAIEWMTFSIGFGQTTGPGGAKLHNLQFGHPAIRMLAPFDWSAYIQSWHIKLIEVSEADRTYYRLRGPFVEAIGPDPCVYFPDNRTLVLDTESEIRTFLLGTESRPRAYLSGEDWARASRGLVAVAINNADGTFARDYDLDRPDDKAVVELLQGVDHWLLDLDDAETARFVATAACPIAEAGAAIRETLQGLLKLAAMQPESNEPAAEADEAEIRAVRVMKKLLTQIRIESFEHSVEVRAEGFGTIADLASILEADLDSMKPDDEGKNESAK
jgi:hypothetical protein